MPYPTPSSSSPDEFPEKSIIINLRTGKALDVKGGSLSCSQGTSIHLWDCFDDRSQVLGNGVCRARCDRGTNIQLWERNRSAAQKLLYNFTDEIICSVSCNGKALDILQITASGTNI